MGAQAGTTRAERVQNLRFGEDVAEHEQNLDSIFLRNNAFWSVVQDEADVVLGAKGTGKSAIARYLTSEDVDIDEIQDVDILPAFNIRGSVLFRRLAEARDGAASSDDYRGLFLAYLAALAGNHLCRSYGSVWDMSDLEGALNRCGLLVKDPTVQSIWKRTLARFKVKQVDTRMRVAQEPQLELAATFESTTGSAAQPDSDELELVIERLYAALETLDRRCWIVLDRLDEAFNDDPEVESLALRGLLQAHLDLCSYGPRFKSKLFLRIDVLERVSRKGGLVNASHLRQVRILWDSFSIIHMVALRSDTEAIRAIGKDEKQVRAAVRTLLPEKIEGQESLVWLLLVTMDANREYIPRNILTLLRAARAAALQALDRTPDHAALLTKNHLQSGYKQLSISRLQDTVLSEFPQLGQDVEALKGRRTGFTRVDLEERLRRDGESLQERIDALMRAGVLRVDGPDKWVIPALLRPAMHQAVHGAEARLGTLHQRDDEGIVIPPDARAEVTADVTEDRIAQPRNTKTRVRQRRKKREHSGRDELVPSGQRPSIIDDLDAVPDVARTLGATDVDGSEKGAPQSPNNVRAKTKPYRFLPDPVPSDNDEQEIERRRAAVHSARALAEAGQLAEAFSVLHPDWIDHRGTACVAADLAYRSETKENLRLAADFLAREHLASSTPIMARRLVLAVALDESVNKLSSLIKRIPYGERREALISVVKMTSQAPSQELGFWNQALGKVVYAVNVPKWHVNAWFLLPASRALAMYRFWRGVDPGRYFALREIVDEVYPADLWLQAHPRIEGYLYAYATNPASCSPEMLPYQVLSLAATLDATGRLSDSLRNATIGRLAEDLATGEEPEHVSRFVAWEEFSSIAVEVVNDSRVAQRLAGRNGALKSPTETPTARLHRADVRSAKGALRDSNRERAVSEEVLTAVRSAVRDGGGIVVSASAAQAALRVSPELARTGWAGAGRFAQFIVDYLPELRYVAMPNPGWVLDPNTSAEEDIPQPLKPGYS